MLWSLICVLVLSERLLVTVTQRTATPVATGFKESLLMSVTRPFRASA